MLVAQDGATHDGKICIGADEVVGKYCNEVQELIEGCPVDLHGRMLGIEGDAMLIIVDIGTVLEIPVLPGDVNGDDPVILPGGMVDTACIALVLRAKLTFGITGLGRSLGCSDGPYGRK